MGDVELKPEILRVVNESPTLLSFLYDINLMPEQIDTKLKAQVMTTAVLAFELGRNDTLACIKGEGE